MKNQHGDGEVFRMKTVRQMREVERLEQFAQKHRRRSTDAPKYHVVDKSGRMLLTVLAGSALFAFGVLFALFFFAVGGDFNLIEWARQ